MNAIVGGHSYEEPFTVTNNKEESMRFQEEPNKPGFLIALDEEAQACLDRMNSPLEQQIESVRSKEVENSELREARISEPAEILGLHKVKVDVPLPCQRSQEDNYVAMGFSREEARIAAGTDAGKQENK